MSGFCECSRRKLSDCALPSPDYAIGSTQPGSTDNRLRCCQAEITDLRHFLLPRRYVRSRSPTVLPPASPNAKTHNASARTQLQNPPRYLQTLRSATRCSIIFVRFEWNNIGLFIIQWRKVLSGELQLAGSIHFMKTTGFSSRCRL